LSRVAGKQGNRNSPKSIRTALTINLIEEKAIGKGEIQSTNYSTRGDEETDLQDVQVLMRRTSIQGGKLRGKTLARKKQRLKERDLSCSCQLRRPKVAGETGNRNGERKSWYSGEGKKGACRRLCRGGLKKQGGKGGADIGVGDVGSGKLYDEGGGEGSERKSRGGRRYQSGENTEGDDRILSRKPLLELLPVCQVDCIDRKKPS